MKQLPLPFKKKCPWEGLSSTTWADIMATLDIDVNEYDLDDAWDDEEEEWDE